MTQSSYPTVIEEVFILSKFTETEIGADYINLSTEYEVYSKEVEEFVKRVNAYSWMVMPLAYERIGFTFYIQSSPTTAKEVSE